MGQWDGRIEELLYEGESIRETVALGDSSVVVTSHRVLALTPETDGANFRQVDRPNVDGVGTGTESDTSHLERAVKAGVVGVVLVGAGWVIDFGAMLGDATLGGAGADRLGLGGVMQSLQQLLGVLRDLDHYMLLLGVLALLAGVAFLGVYLWGRERALVIRVAGDEDIHVPRPDGAADAARRVEAAMAPDPDPGDATREDPLGEA